MRRRRQSSIVIVFETHSTTTDNERWIASGWLDGRLSIAGKRQASELGERRRREGVAAVFTSDLGRAVETTQIAFGELSVPVFHDWRLRECDYGELNGTPLDNSFGGNSNQFRILLEALTMEQLSQIWGALNADYRLAVAYNVRIVAIDSDQGVSPAPRVLEAHTVVGRHG